jgi:hypothetical protein
MRRARLQRLVFATGATLATLLAIATLLPVSDQGSPANPVVQPPPPDDGQAADQSTDAGMADAIGDSAPITDSGNPVFYGACPDGMTADFPSILTRMLATTSCGVARAYDCHSSTGALPRADGGSGSLLDFSLDASAVYRELLGDGSGYPSTNIAGDAGAVVLRVAPGDAQASMLYIKLALSKPMDPRYGQAMPPTAAVCPAVLTAVAGWINDGAAPD